MGGSYGENDMLVVEPDLLDSKMLFSHVCTPGLLYTCSLTLANSLLFSHVWDVCWPIVLRTHGIGLTIVFSHGISPIKEKHCNTTVYGIVAL